MSRSVRRGLAAIGLCACLSAGAAASEQAAAIKDGAVLGVRSGMTLIEARRAAPSLSWDYEPTFMVDFSALCAAKSAENRAEDTLFCARIEESATERPGARIVVIAAIGKDLATPEGVGPGMTVAAASAIYGAADLSYNLENEARETLSFAKAPEWLGFAAASESTESRYAGVYPPLPKGATIQTTSEFAEDAVIEMLWVNAEP